MFVLSAMDKKEKKSKLQQILIYLKITVVFQWAIVKNQSCKADLSLRALCLEE